MSNDRNLASLDPATASDWLNSPPLTEAALKGQVVIVHFWTFTCINWLRTQSYLRAWDEKYRDHGAVMVGVHTPEFSFEHDLDNVRRETANLNVGYPVVIDNDYRIWMGFNNHYWPALYLVDGEGNVRHHHFGEGGFADTERALRGLLEEAGNEPVGDEFVSVVGEGAEAQADWDDLESPEAYLGYQQAVMFASPGPVASNRRTTYEIPDDLELNEWALAGDWTIGGEAVVLDEAGGRIAFRFHARDVNLVMGSTDGVPVRFRVTVDGAAPGEDHGTDADADGAGVASDPRLYQLIRQRGPIVHRTFEIEFLDAGARGYSFTFG